MAKLKREEIEAILRKKFELRFGKFGMYIRDNEAERDMPLAELVTLLNKWSIAVDAYEKIRHEESLGRLKPKVPSEVPLVQFNDIVTLAMAAVRGANHMDAGRPRKQKHQERILVGAAVTEAFRALGITVVNDFDEAGDIHQRTWDSLTGVS